MRRFFERLTVRSRLSDKADRITTILKLERDICYLYYQIAEWFDDSFPAAFPDEIMDFVNIYSLPYWEYLDIEAEGLGLRRRDFIREGCLVILMRLAYASLEPLGYPLRAKLPACRTAINAMDLRRDRVRQLAFSVLKVIDAAERGEKVISEEMQEDSLQVADDFIWPYFRSRARRPRAPLFFREADPVKVQRQKMDWHIGQAAAAYDRLYSAGVGADAAAAYSDCKESLGAAISLALKTGLEEKAVELERKLAHCKEVFRNQFD